MKYFRVGFTKIVFSQSEDLLGKHIPRFPSVKQCCDTLVITRMAKLDAMTLWFLLERICDA